MLTLNSAILELKWLNFTSCRLLTCRTASFPFDNPDNRIQISKSCSEHQSTIGRHLPQLPYVVPQPQAKRNNLHASLAHVPCRGHHTVVRPPIRHDNTHFSSSASTEEIAVRIIDGSPGLGTSFRIAYTAHSTQHLVLVSVPIEAKYFESSCVIKDGADSREATWDDKSMDHVPNELKAAFEVEETNTTWAIDDETKVQPCFANWNNSKSKKVENIFIPNQYLSYESTTNQWN